MVKAAHSLGDGEVNVVARARGRGTGAPEDRQPG